MKGYPREILQKNGDFGPKFLCNICQLILREPVQAFCGHRFCRVCLEARLRDGGPMRCQQCQNEDPKNVSLITHEQIYPDNGVKREMARLIVVCANPGCDWQGIFREYEAHLNMACVKALVICPQCGIAELLREKLPAHQQSDSCRGVPVVCPAGCGWFERKDYQEHFQRSQHEAWVVQKVAQLERQVNGLTSRSDASNVSGGSRGTENIDSRHEMRPNPGNRREEFGEHLPAIERMRRDFQIMEAQIGLAEDKITSLEKNLTQQDLKIEDLKKMVENQEFGSCDGKLVWRVSDFNKKRQDAMVGQSLSFNSPPFYTSKYGYKLCARLYPDGDGIGKGSHLSLFFVVMRGDFDPLLKWPFDQKIRFELVNQSSGEHVVDSFRPDPYSSSFRCPTSDMNIASGCPLFIRQEIVMNEDNGFLKDDTIFIKVSVEEAPNDLSFTSNDDYGNVQSCQ